MASIDTIRQALTCGQPGCTCGQPRGNVHCPSHEDKAPSLSVSQNNGRVLVKCFGGCSQAAVIDALKARDLWPSPNGDRSQALKSRIVKTYDYQDADGNLVFQVCRMEPKDFRQRRPDPQNPGKWVWNLERVTRVPYRLPQLLKANTVFVDEGEKDVHSLEALGLTATCNPGGALKWRREFNKHFQGKAVVILPDNDPPDKNHPEGVGRAHAQQVARHLHGMAASVKVVELPGLPDHGDVSDWLKAGGTKEKLLALVETAPEWKPTPHQAERPKTAPQQLAQARKGHPIQFVSGKELETLDFPEPVWIIPNILGEGYIILAGRPKLGKSWLGLCLAVAVATGGCALGKGELRATQGKVLYLALEDRLRRIKKRLGQIMCGSPFPENLLLAESWQRLDKGGLEDLRLFLREHDDCRMVVIDTLAKVCPPRTKNRDLYEFDMSVGGSLQALANQFRVSILVVHHTRKSEANDPLDEVSGSTGVTGAADAVMVLKRGRGQADGTLTLAGRDIEEQELALQFRPQEGLWELLGDAAEYSMSQERHEVLSILREIGPKTPAQLSKILDKKRENIKKLLLKMKDSGLVIANKKGEYKTLSI